MTHSSSPAVALELEGIGIRPRLVRERLDLTAKETARRRGLGHVRPSAVREDPRHQGARQCETRLVIRHLLLHGNASSSCSFHVVVLAPFFFVFGPRMTRCCFPLTVLETSSPTTAMQFLDQTLEHRIGIVLLTVDFFFVYGLGKLADLELAWHVPFWRREGGQQQEGERQQQQQEGGHQLQLNHSDRCQSLES